MRHEQDKELGLETCETNEANESSDQQVGKRKSGAVRSQAKEEGLRAKFGLDLADQPEAVQLIQDLLNRANNKTYGRKIDIKDIFILALRSITDAGIVELQDKSMSKMDKIHLLHDRYNSENQTNLSFDEFLFQKLNVQ